MQARNSVERWGGLTVLGAILVLVGVGWFVLRELRIDPFAEIAAAGWPFFVIIPGVALLIASLVLTPPHGVGLAIAGSIVTTVGAVLLYQQATGHWESWAYAWALVGPGGAGLGMLVYGLIFGQRDLLAAGARLVAIAAAIFAVGYWYFETIFASGRAPLELGEWWPVVVVGVGLFALVAGLLSRGSRRGAPQIHPSAPGDVR
jgi:hypothetical protein